MNDYDKWILEKDKLLSEKNALFPDWITDNWGRSNEQKTE